MLLDSLSREQLEGLKDSLQLLEDSRAYQHLMAEVRLRLSQANRELLKELDYPKLLHLQCRCQVLGEVLGLLDNTLTDIEERIAHDSTS